MKSRARASKPGKPLSPALQSVLTYLPFLVGSTILLLIVYGPSLQGEFVWDDERTVLGAARLPGLSGLWRIWTDPSAVDAYYPFQYTSYWLEHHLWGISPTGYHVTNVILHALAGTLLAAVLRRLHIPGSFLAASFFLFHPMQVESVAWISERKNVLAGAFFFAAMLAYLRFDPIDTSPRRRVWYAVAVLLYLAALLSKSIACTLPAVLALLIYWKKGRLSKRDWAALAPLFFLGLAVGLLAAWFEVVYGHSNGGVWDLSFLERCLIAGRALVFYAGKLLWPYPIILVYPRWHIELYDPVGWIYPLIALSCLATCWLLRRRWGRTPFVSAAYFAGSLFPAIGFFNIGWMRYSFVNDHCVYLASLGILVPLAGVFVLAWERAKSGTIRRTISIGLAGVLVTLALLSREHAGDFRTARGLWSATLTANPSAWVAHHNLGTVLSRNGNDFEAVGHFEIAVKAAPDFAMGHCNLGRTLTALNQKGRAILHLEKAVELEPDTAAFRHNLAVGYAMSGRMLNSLRECERTIALDSTDADAHCLRGALLADLGRISEAIREYSIALELSPGMQRAKTGLSNCLAVQGGAERAQP